MVNGCALNFILDNIKSKRFTTYVRPVATRKYCSSYLLIETL